jgi:hypothetical protein
VEANSPANAAAWYAAQHCEDSGHPVGVVVLNPGDSLDKAQHFLVTAAMEITYTARPASPRICERCKQAFLHENNDSTEELCRDCD